MADATRHYYAKLNLHGNQLKDFAVDNVDELPMGTTGQLVFFENHLWLYDDTDWIQVSDSVILTVYQTRDEKDKAGGYLGIGEDGKVDVQFIPTGVERNTLPLLKGTILDGQSIKFSQEAGGFVAFDIGTLYTYKGTCTSAELDLIEDQRVGDVWNLTDARVWQGHNYVAGTSWAWEGTEWEPLAGALDLSGYQTIENMVSSLSNPNSTTYPSTIAVTDYVTANRTPVINDWASASTTNVPSASLVQTALDRKTDMTMAIPAWDSATVYANASTVIREQTLYISIQPANLNHDPVEDTAAEWWMPIQGGGGAGGGGNVRCVSHFIGNDTDTIYEVYHGFMTQNVFVSVRTNASPSRIVDVQTELLSNVRIRLTFTSPPGSSGAVVSIMAVTEASGGDTMVYTQSEASDSWDIQHDFGTWCFIQVYGEDGDQKMADVVQSSDLNSVTVSFGSPTTGSVVIASAGSAVASETLSGEGAGRTRTVKLGDARMLSLENASGEWVIEHGKGRLVLVQVYGTNGDEIKADVIQDMQTLNSVTIRFSRAVSGTAVIM